MIRIKVCKLSDIISDVIVFFIYLLLLVIIIKFILVISKNINEKMARILINNTLISVENGSTLSENKNLYERIILSQLPKIKNIRIKNDKKVDESTFKIPSTINEDLINIKNETLVAEKLSESKVKIGSVKIENYTKDELDYEELSKALAVSVPQKAKVLIYHTHTSESYSGIEEYSDYYRTTDDESNVVSVGRILKEHLSQCGFEAVHDDTVHDHLSYGGAYKASLNTIEKRIKEKKYDVLIDIHRDALAANDKFRPTAEINGETVAKLMFVVGTNDAGLKHDNWIENLKFAIAFQERANRMYPGLFRDIHLSTSRYNQHMSDKAIILEVGATGNTIEEAKASMKYFAIILNSMK